MSLDNPAALVPKCICCRVTLLTSESEDEDTSSRHRSCNLEEEIKNLALDFDWFVNLLGLPKPSKSEGFGNSSDLEADKKGSEFCSGCSEVVLSLATLQDLLEKTKVSIQEKLEWIRRTVETAASSVQDVLEEEPRFCFIRTEISKTGQNKTKTRSHNDKECSIQQQDNVDTENEVEIKLELSYLPENDFEETAFEVGGFDELITIPGLSGGEVTDLISKTPDAPIFSDVDENQAVEKSTDKSVFEEFKASRSEVSRKATRRKQDNRLIYTKFSKVGHEQQPSIGGRPSRQKRKSVRLNGYADSLKIEEIEIANNNSIGQLSQSDMQILSRFGLDKLPKLQIQLEDICHPILKKRQPHKHNLRVDTVDSIRPARFPNVPNLNGIGDHREDEEQSEFEYPSPSPDDEDSEFELPVKRLKTLRNNRSSKVMPLNQKTNRRNLYNMIKTRRIQPTNSKVDVANNENSDLPGKSKDLCDPDFQPISDDHSDSDSSTNSGSESEFNSESEELRPKPTSKARKSRNRIEKKRDPNVPVKIRRRRGRQAMDLINNAAILIEKGTRFYRKLEIIEEGDYLLCAFKTCDFKVLKNADDAKSCEEMLQHLTKSGLHSKDNKQYCNYCETLFQSPRELRRHRAEYHRQELITECEICRKPLTTKFMRRHQWSHFNDEERAAWVASGKTDPILSNTISKEKSKCLQKNLYQCAECGKQFSRLYSLENHELTHIEMNKRQQIMCDQCGDVFTTKRGLYFHSIRVHNPEAYLSKWKICMICDKKFLVQTHLDIHNRRHHGAEKIHKCDKCDRSFSDKDGLKQHAVVHLPEHRPYKCPFCEIAYRYDKNLYRHIGKVHKDKHFEKPKRKSPHVFKLIRPPAPLPVMTCKQMYPCPICDKVFPLPSRLKKHMKASHKEAEDDDNENGNVLPDNSTEFDQSLQQNQDAEEVDFALSTITSVQNDIETEIAQFIFT